MLAIKENRQYTITEVDVQSFASEGYDVYDDNGNLVAYGVGKTVPFEKYAKLMKQHEKLQDEIIELREQVKALEKKGAKKG
jgi:hypothetical protein